MPWDSVFNWVSANANGRGRCERHGKEEMIVLQARKGVDYKRCCSTLGAPPSPTSLPKHFMHLLPPEGALSIKGTSLPATLHSTFPFEHKVALGASAIFPTPPYEGRRRLQPSALALMAGAKCPPPVDARKE